MSWFFRNYRRRRDVARLQIVLASALIFAGAMLLSATPSHAQCVGTPTVTCSGTTDNVGNGFGAGAENNLSINVQPGALVRGTNHGISIADDDTINNAGSIIGTGGNGIDAGIGLSVFNSGVISGGNHGIFATGASVFNAQSGVIRGVVHGINADDIVLTNFGTVAAGQTAIRALAGTANVLNFGTLSGGFAANSAGISANVVNLTNYGTISGWTGVIASSPGAGAGSTLDNSGKIFGTFAAIDFSSSANDTLTFRPGSRIVGSIELGTNDIVNIHTGRDVGWLLVFGNCGCGPITTTGSVVNFFGKGIGVLVGDRIATLDPTAFGLSDRTLMDFTGAVSSLAGSRLSELGGSAGTGSGATAFAAASSPVVNVANAAFASAMPVSSYAPETKGPGALSNAHYVDRASSTAIWTKAFAGLRHQDSDEAFLASRTTIYGGAIGMDGQVGSNLRAGLFFGAGYGKLDVDKSSQTVETDYLFGGVYGRYDWNAHFIDFAVSGGHSSNDNERLVANNLASDGLETAKSKYNGWYLSPELAYGIRIPVANDMILTPTARVRYLTGHFDGYSETGSAQNLSVAGRDLQDIEERFELALSRFDPIASGVLKTTATLGAVGVQRIGDKTINSNLIGQNIAFITPGDDASYGGYVGLGFDYRASQRVNLFAGVEGTMMNDKSRTGTARGGVRVAF